MNRRPAQIAAYLVALILVFIVGVLTGTTFCAPEPEQPDQPDGPDEPEQPDCPPAEPQLPKFVEYCPPDQPDEDSEGEPPDPPQRDESADGDELPDAPPPVDPEQRRELLGWARDQSSTLEGCPRDLGTTHRLAITLQIDDDRQVDNASVSAEDDLDPALESCIVERIEQWEVPEHLDPHGRELFFRLTL